jgi:UDP-N-acetylglucosamine 2-epimerase (non-hydrolysing)
MPTNRLAEPEGVGGLARSILDGGVATPASPPPLWDGRAGERIADVIQGWLARRPDPTPRSSVLPP